MILLSAVVAAQKQLQGGTQPSAPPASTPGVNQATPKNKIRFPYGVQTFEKKEYLRLASEITVIPGWNFVASPSMVDAVVTESPLGLTRPGTESRRWLAIDDVGGGANQGFTTPTVQAPSPWNYHWAFTIQVDAAPVSTIDAPTFAIQHGTMAGFQDAWGVQLTPTGAELYTTNAWGSEQVVPILSWGGLTDLGQWIDLRVDASVQNGTLKAFVNGTEVGMIRSRPAASTDVTKMRFSYHGGGAGNSTSMFLDDLAIAFGGPVCQENLSLTFTTEDDDEIALANGQAITDPPEFGEKLFVTGSGLNNGAAIFDSDPAGPNAVSQDPDLLVNQGNILILQTDAPANPPIVADIYPRPNDDEDGGTFDFDFIRPLQALTIDLIDVDPGETMTITLTDFSAETRTYNVPGDWTGNGGVGTLDLQDTNPQAGFNSVTPAPTDSSASYDPNAVVSMTVELSGSGALDNLEALIPCVLLAFEVEDDATPVFTGTTLANGQDISDPPEFGVEVSISDAGPNVGAAIFDSTPAGPNALGPDKDLLVGLFNILILQNDTAATQTTTGFFDIPNDDTQGGSLFFDFPGTVRVNRVDLIDVDEEESVGITVTLEDLGGNMRIYTVPIGWTEDLLNDGPPGFRTLDLSTLAPQPGWDPPGAPVPVDATGVDVGAFDPDEVIKLTIDLGGAQAVDNICFCP
jgi:hypothetical protein